MRDKLEYSVIESDRAKRLRIAVYPGKKVVVTKPRGLSPNLVADFVESKVQWIEKKLNEAVIEPGPDLVDTTYNHYLFNRGKARKLVRKKLAEWNKIYNFEYRRVSIKQLKSRWGSCSADGGLNFNYKILYLPEAMQDYVIIHELCHLRERSHSEKFWLLVSLAHPQYQKIKNDLKALNR